MSELHKFLGKIKEVAQTTEGFISQKVEAMLPSMPNPENNNLDSSRFKQVWNQIETAPYHNKNQPLDQAHIQHQDASKTASVSSTEKEKKPDSLILQIREQGTKIHSTKLAVLTPEEKKLFFKQHAEQSIVKLDNIRSLLSQANNQPISPAMDQLLQDKTKTIKTNLSQMFNLAGSKEVVQDVYDISSNPLKKFFNFVVDGQVSLRQLTHDVQSMDPKTMSPANFLALQIKVVHIQQELDFFANVLNQTLSGIKNLMNVQI